MADLCVSVKSQAGSQSRRGGQGGVDTGMSRRDGDAMDATRFLPPLGMLGLLSACAGGTVVQSTPPPSRLAPPPQLHRTVPGLRVQNLPGLEAVIGATAPQLTRQFGPPRLDVIEGDVRKLQFTGAACVLDVYLYPSGPGQVPEAAYVDARRADGHDVDRAACVVALRRPGTK